MAAPLTALGNPTARFAWSADAQASFDALKLALSSTATGESYFASGTDPKRQYTWVATMRRYVMAYE